MVYKILDLFAGVGGLSLGFELSRNKNGKKIFELHKAVEIDRYACQTLRANYGAEKVIEGDLTNKEIHQKILSECRGKVDVVVGGIPCQSFSLIGPRSGFGKSLDKFKEDERDNLYKQFKDIVNGLNPKIIVLENVKGILSKRNKLGVKIIDNIITDFEKLGYKFENKRDNKKYFLLNAADYGVPQKRERVILIGVRKEIATSEIYLEPKNYDPNKINAEELSKKGLLPYVTLNEAIGDLPFLKPKVTMTGINKAKASKVVEENLKFNNGEDRMIFDYEVFRNHLNNISASGVKFFKHIRGNSYAYLDNHVCRSQQFSDIRLFSVMKPGETAKDFATRCPKLAQKLIKYNMDSFMDKYRRQKGDELSTTVFAHLEKDGNRFIHPTQPRTFTPREAARIQSFPDDFIFCGPMSKKYKQIGNAVPPLLSKAIAGAVEKLL